MTERLTLRISGGILAVFCVVLLLSAVLSGEVFLAAADDAFFYFTIAGNFVEEGMLSFDGLTPTNGFHPLWMALLAGLRYVVEGPSYLLASLILSTILMTSAGFLFLRFGGNRFSPPVTALMLLLLLRYIRDFALLCMETSVLLPLLFIELIMLENLDRRSVRADYARLGIVIALAGLARLDSALLGILVIVATLRRGGWKMVIPLTLPGMIAASAYLAGNRFFMGTWFSVSGGLKASDIGLNTNFAGQLFALSDPLGLMSPWGLYLLMLIPALVCSLGRRVPASARVSGAFMVLFTLFQLFFSQWRIWYWYAYPAVVFLVFGVTPIVDSLYKRLRIPEWAEKTLMVVGLGITCIATGYWGLNYTRVPRDDFRYRNMMIAEELNSELPEDAVVAIGDRAGSFAFFFHGHVIQAEGLAGDQALAAAVMEQELERYLLDMGADYLLSWTGPHGVTDYETWEILIPDPAQCTVFNNSLVMHEEREVARWPGEGMSVFLWSLNEI